MARVVDAAWAQGAPGDALTRERAPRLQLDQGARTARAFCTGFHGFLRRAHVTIRVDDVLVGENAVGDHELAHYPVEVTHSPS